MKQRQKEWNKKTPLTNDSVSYCIEVMFTVTEQFGALISFLAIIEFARHRLSHESAKTVGADEYVRNITFN